MFIETSAIVAILAGEAEAAGFLDIIERSEHRETGAHVRLEATINLARILGLGILDAQELFDGFIRAARITVVPVDDRIARWAVEAFHLRQRPGASGSAELRRLPLLCLRGSQPNADPVQGTRFFPDRPHARDRRLKRSTLLLTRCEPSKRAAMRPRPARGPARPAS